MQKIIFNIENMKKEEWVNPEIFDRYPELACGVATRSFFDGKFSEGLDRKKAEDREKALVASGNFFWFQKIAFSQQTHSDRVAVVESEWFVWEADALVTRQKNLALVIKTADCGQIFLFDPVAEVIGAVHAGWKGHSLRILEKTVTVMIGLWAKAERLICFVGPSIEARNYEVGADGTDFGQWFEDGTLLPHWEPGKKFFDGKYESKRQLLKMGVPENQIEVSNLCTFEEKNLYSYRRDGADAGRMIGVIGMKS